MKQIRFLGFNYFYRDYEDREPFRSELHNLNFAWNAGRQNSAELCSNLNITRTCKRSSVRLMEAFHDIYNENEFTDSYGESEETQLNILSRDQHNKTCFGGKDRPNSPDGLILVT